MWISYHPDALVVCVLDEPGMARRARRPFNHTRPRIRGCAAELGKAGRPGPVMRSRPTSLFGGHVVVRFCFCFAFGPGIDQARCLGLGLDVLGCP